MYLQEHFCWDHVYGVHYFVFVDANMTAEAPPDPSITLISKTRQGWPRDSDDRYTWLHQV